jgi:hypothetical protein
MRRPAFFVLRFWRSFARRSRWEVTTLLSRLTLTPLTLNDLVTINNKVTVGDYYQHWS